MFGRKLRAAIHGTFWIPIKHLEKFERIADAEEIGYKRKKAPEGLVNDMAVFNMKTADFLSINGRL